MTCCPQSTLIRALIVDDEPLARQRIRTLLEDYAHVSPIGEAGNGVEAVELILSQRPDLVFLDVQMPVMDGFDVLEAIAQEFAPVIVFVTAYDQHAIRAFDVNALDYLLKPFDQNRFARAVLRAGEELARRKSPTIPDNLQALLNSVGPRKPIDDRILVKSSGRVHFLKIDTIDFIESAGNYVKLCIGKEHHLLRETMQHVEERLEPKGFIRIHRETIVNVDRIKELQAQFNGDYIVVLRDGTRLTLSRRFRHKLGKLADLLH